MEIRKVKDMSREIKFRFWDTYNKEMIYRDLYFFEEEGIRTVPDVYSDQYKVMQYTGLKDNQGKEIYEGDIVKFKPDSGYDIGQVVYGKHNGAFCFYLPHLGIRVPMLNSIQNTMSLVADSDFEVMGNVYEHPSQGVERAST